MNYVFYRAIIRATVFLLLFFISRDKEYLFTRNMYVSFGIFRILVIPDACFFRDDVTSINMIYYYLFAASHAIQ